MAGPPELHGRIVRLRPVDRADVAALAEIRLQPEVRRHWRGSDDMVAEVVTDLAEPDSTPYVIEVDGAVAGWIQWAEETEPDYRHASIDIYLSAALHGRGVGTDAVRTLARHLIVDHCHHRLIIDPAADNPAAIACYAKVGFQRVGITRQSERGPDGSWHDGLLMDLLAEDFIDS